MRETEHQRALRVCRQEERQARERRREREAAMHRLEEGFRLTSDEAPTSPPTGIKKFRSFFSSSSSAQKNTYLSMREGGAHASGRRRARYGAQGARQSAPAGRHWSEFFGLFFFFRIHDTRAAESNSKGESSLFLFATLSVSTVLTDERRA